jgi:dienelactone hydrolase
MACTEWALMTVRIAGAPVLLTSRRPPEAAAGRGTVLMSHGFGSDKRKLEDLAGMLADAGFLAVRVDIVGHGERRLPDWDQVFSHERWTQAEDATEAAFLTLLRATAAEVPAIVDDLTARGWVHEGRLGITGRSMGGESGESTTHPGPRHPAAGSRD